MSHHQPLMDSASGASAGGGQTKGYRQGEHSRSLGRKPVEGSNLFLAELERARREQIGGIPHRVRPPAGVKLKAIAKENILEVSDENRWKARTCSWPNWSGPDGN